jgi:D-alanyl-D-alanine carboxypeptidase
LVFAVVLALAACTSAPNGMETTATVSSTVAPRPSTRVVPAASTTAPTERAVAFPVGTFAAISDDPVTEELAGEFQAALSEMLDLPLVDGIVAGGGMSATVMTAVGTWSGTAGKADGVRDLGIDDQFAIGSVTKSVVAAQVMQLVEAGDLSLDDQADEHLPADLEFDTNEATIRHLLSHRSGFRNPDEFIWDTLATDRQHVWTLAEVLELTGDPDWPAGSKYEYSNANYFLLGQIIEQSRGRPLAQVLRDGVLAMQGVERLVYQPDERPSEPMAMPAGESTAALESGGGYLSSIAGATGGGPAAAIASDSPSLARWWRAFCTGEIVSPSSLAEMATPAGSDDYGLGYGLGVFNVAGGYGPSVGHAGADYGFASWAGCLPEHGAVVVVLANREVDDIMGMARPLIDVLRSA